MAPPALGALDVVLAAASKTAMVLRPLCREDVLTAAAAPTVVPVAAAAEPPVPLTSAAGAVGATPCPLRLGDVVVVAMAKTPLLERLRAASKSAFFVSFCLVGMAMGIIAEVLMLAQKHKNEGMVAKIGGCGRVGVGVTMRKPTTSYFLFLVTFRHNRICGLAVAFKNIVFGCLPALPKKIPKSRCLGRAAPNQPKCQ